MHCTGFDFSYCCILPPYNSIQAQFVKVGVGTQAPRLLDHVDPGEYISDPRSKAKSVVGHGGRREAVSRALRETFREETDSRSGVGFEVIFEAPATLRSLIHSDGSLLFVTPPMCGLDVVRMIVPPPPAHSFRISMVGDDVVIIAKLFVADCAYARLLSNFAIQ